MPTYMTLEPIGKDYKSGKAIKADREKAMHCSIIIRVDNATLEDNPGAELSRMLRDVALYGAGDVRRARSMRTRRSNDRAVGWFAVWDEGSDDML